jgi:hypothetical protein
MTRTCAWLAKPATASSAIARIGVLGGVLAGGAGGGAYSTGG